MRLWPRSLAGQMALLIAIALFAAQAVNFGLILRDRTQFRLAAVTRPVATRIADALEREARGERGILPGHGRIRRAAANPLSGEAVLEHRPEVAAELGRQLAEAGVTVGRTDAAVRAPRPGDELELRGPFRGLEGRLPQVLVLAAEQPGRGWLAVLVPWPRPGQRLLWELIGQTLILYGVILLPVLWAARRISRPLRDLTQAAGAFDPLSPTPALVEQGPDDLRQLIAAFNALRLRVTAMVDEKDRMLGALGHDLRTPLAALRVRVESVEDEQDRTRMADTIAEMNRMLDDILSLARIGRPSEPLTEVDVAALVDAVVEDFRDLGQDVTFAETSRLPMRLRSGLMRRAVRNLIENAVKYGGGAAVSIAVTPDRVSVVVADTGPGIPPDRLEAVFDPFTRLESSRNRDTGGIGLGLALARSIVRDARGDILLHNRPTGGLEATISLPR